MAELIHKRFCNMCGGSGRVEVLKKGTISEYVEKDCPVCDGTGKVIVNSEHPS